MKNRPFAIVLPSLRRHRRQLWIALAATTCSQLIGVPLPLLTRTMIHAVGREGLHPGSSDYSGEQLIWIFATVLLGLTCVRAILRWQQGVCGERLAQGVLAEIRGQMYAHVQRLSLGYFDRRPAGRVLIRFISDANALRTWLSRTVVAVPADVLTILCIATAVGSIHIEVLFAALIPLIVLVPTIIWINPRARLWTRKSRRRQSVLCNVLNERLGSLASIKSACAQRVDGSSVQRLIDNVAAANVSRARLDAWGQSLSTGAATASLAAVGVWGARLFLDGAISQADLLAAIWLTLLFRGPIARLANANVIHQRARVAVERIGSLLNRPVEPGWSRELPAYNGPGRRIQFRRLGYRGQDGRWLLRDFNAVIRGPGLVTIADDGRHLGRVLLELLMRLRRPHKGRIRLDRMDVRKLSVDSIRRNMGWLDRDRRVVNVVSFALEAEEWTQIERRIKELWPQTERIAPDASLAECFSAMRSLSHRSWNDARLARDARLRFAICCALIHEPAYLFMDNPTRDLDGAETQQFINWLEGAAHARLILAVTADHRLLNTSLKSLRIPSLSQENEVENSPIPAGSIGAMAGLRMCSDLPASSSVP